MPRKNTAKHPPSHGEPAELAVITKTYDLIMWYVPHIQKFPRDFRFVLGERIETTLYDLLDHLVAAKYSPKRVEILQWANILLQRLRYQTRMVKDFKLFDTRRYEFATAAAVEVGRMVGGWAKDAARRRPSPPSPLSLEGRGGEEVQV